MSAETGSAFTIFIESGLHAGTVQRFSPGIYTLGSELDADIVLSDSQINAIHLIVEFDRHGLRLEPLQGPVAIDGESVSLDPGGERHLALPASFRIGDVAIKVSAPKDAVQTRKRRLAGMVAAGVAALAVIGFQAFGTLTEPALDGPTAAPIEPAATTDNAGGDPQLEEKAAARDLPVDEAAAATAEVTLDQAAAALRERLTADGLMDIEVKTAVDRIVVRGEAEPDRMGAWQDARIWFDGAFGQSVLMAASVEAAEAAEPPKLAIEAVWSGEDPYLIAGGQRFFVGAHIGDGWTIDRIGTDEITFKRGDKSFSLAL